MSSLGLFLEVERDSYGDVHIRGERDALVTLRSAINEALARGLGHADLADEVGFYRKVTTRRVGP
jgi:hypothetical protein